MLALDLSNYTDPLTPDALEAWKAAGVGLVIVQAVDPPAGYPSGRTRAQIQACLDAGLPVDAYVWLWFDYGAQSVDDTHHKLSLLNGLAIRQLWLDTEDTAAIKYSQEKTEQIIDSALRECDAYSTTNGKPCGVYSGRGYWTDRRYLANSTAFADRELWDANYDDVVDAALGYVPYGGWAAPRIKQYHGTTSIGGIGGVDLNVLSVDEAAELAPPDPGDPDQGWLARKSQIVGLAGELVSVGDQLRAAANADGGPTPDTILPLADAVQSRANAILE